MQEAVLKVLLLAPLYKPYPNNVFTIIILAIFRRIRWCCNNVLRYKLLTVGIVFGNAVKYMGLFGAILFIIIVGATAILLKGRQKPQQ
ncbi:hypothetical protein ACVPOQ_10140 [Staphylococcus aureus]